MHITYSYQCLNFTHAAFQRLLTDRMYPGESFILTPVQYSVLLHKVDVVSRQISKAMYSPNSYEGLGVRRGNKSIQVYKKYKRIQARKKNYFNNI